MLLAKIMALARIRKVLETSFSELLPWRNLGGILLAAMVAAIPAIILNSKLDIPVLVFRNRVHGNIQCAGAGFWTLGQR